MPAQIANAFTRVGKIGAILSFQFTRDFIPYKIALLLFLHFAKLDSTYLMLNRARTHSVVGKGLNQA